MSARDDAGHAAAAAWHKRYAKVVETVLGNMGATRDANLIAAEEAVENIDRWQAAFDGGKASRGDYNRAIRKLEQAREDALAVSDVTVCDMSQLQDFAKLVEQAGNNGHAAGSVIIRHARLRDTLLSEWFKATDPLMAGPFDFAWWAMDELQATSVRCAPAPTARYRQDVSRSLGRDSGRTMSRSPSRDRTDGGTRRDWPRTRAWDSERCPPPVTERRPRSASCTRSTSCGRPGRGDSRDKDVRGDRGDRDDRDSSARRGRSRGDSRDGRRRDDRRRGDGRDDYSRHADYAGGHADARRGRDDGAGKRREDGDGHGVGLAPRAPPRRPQRRPRHVRTPSPPPPPMPPSSTRPPTRPMGRPSHPRTSSKPPRAFCSGAARPLWR